MKNICTFTTIKIFINTIRLIEKVSAKKTSVFEVVLHLVLQIEVKPPKYTRKNY